MSEKKKEKGIGFPGMPGNEMSPSLFDRWGRPVGLGLPPESDEPFKIVSPFGLEKDINYQKIWFELLKYLDTTNELTADIRARLTRLMVQMMIKDLGLDEE